MTGPGEAAAGRNAGDAGDHADPRYAVGPGVLDTHIAWRSLVMSGMTAFAVVALGITSEAMFSMGHAATVGACYVACFACVYAASRFFHARTARTPMPPLPTYWGETRVTLLIVAYCLLPWGDPSLARPGYVLPGLSLMLGGCVDGFWLAGVAVRRGVGLRQAAVLAARSPYRVPGGAGR